MRTMVFENVLRAAVVGGLCVACASTPGTSGETHFLCAKTADCTPHASDLVCVEGECQRQPEGDTGTPVATKSPTPDAAQNDSPAQGAVTVQVTPTAGNTCKYTNGRVGIPSDRNASVVSELFCDPSMGCKPDEYVVQNGQPDTTLTCRVHPSDGKFDVSAALNVDGSATGTVSMAFQINGTVDASGGTVAVTESNSVAGGGGSDTACTMTITPTSGFIRAGAIWGAVTCSNLADGDSTACTLDGQFLFEGCDE